MTIMVALTANIEIKSKKTWSFDRIVGVEITRDAETLTDRCVVTLPRKVKWQGEVTMPIRRGDGVTVRLGYDGVLQAAFSGYVTAIGHSSPVTITCEDYMFRLKQQTATKKAYKSATLDQMLRDQQLGIQYKLSGEQHLGAYRVTADTVSGLLAHLREHYAVRSFIRHENDQPVLYAGALFEGSVKPTQVFSVGRNIIDNTQLREQTAEDVKVRVKAVSLQPDNKTIRVEVGDTDPDAEVHTMRFHNKDEKELRAWAEQELKRLKRDGLSGSFTTFGAQLVDKLDPIGIKIDGERRGIYQVQKNVINYGDGGFRQQITLGRKIGE